jgi:galactitol-specific phosphotransferase system IIB component
MIKVSTLRNIITLLAVLFFTACSNGYDSSYYVSGDLKSVSSEDKYTEMTQVGQIISEENGRTILVVSKK